MKKDGTSKTAKGQEMGKVSRLFPRCKKPEMTAAGKQK
jgi:hypothetical protein